MFVPLAILFSCVDTDLLYGGTTITNMMLQPTGMSSDIDELCDELERQMEADNITGYEGSQPGGSRPELRVKEWSTTRHSVGGRG